MFNSGWKSWFIFMAGSDNLMNHPAQRYNTMSPIRTVITTITRKSVNRGRVRRTGVRRRGGPPPLSGGSFFFSFFFFDIFQKKFGGIGECYCPPKPKPIGGILLLGCLVDWLLGWLVVGWLVGWFGWFGWLVWLVGWFVC